MRDTDFTDILDRSAERGPVPLEEQLAVLRGLGMEIPEKAADIDLSYGAGDYEMLLLSIGWGNYNFETGEWTPSSRQVFAFDAEVYSIEDMYLNYLKGLQSISQGELDFSDAAQDNSNVDWDGPDGTVGVTFRLNGMECRYHAQFQGDWLDVRIRAAINGFLEKLGVEKRFYATPGGQGEIVFFCTEAWARQFEEATLCYMSDGTF